MNHIFIDIETFSSVDITKSGLFKYAQSKDFEVLLFGYSLNNSPVKVIDLAQGENIPQEVITILTSSSWVKHAYNAAFEWYCLSIHFEMSEQERINNLQQWNDTMLHGLYCGYPAGLAAIGKALGMAEEKQKLSTGRALIKFFSMPCTPTKINGQRTRNLPHHEPEKWNLYKVYNAQDVEAEMEIGRLLAQWPVPEFLQEQWLTDQVINLRGVAIDTELVTGALALAAQNKEEMLERAKQITGLENPKSVSQLSAWVEEKTSVKVDNLQKQTVSELIKSTDNEEVKEALYCRQELSKTSTKKYDAMVAARCDDGRIRGILQFYGANRTGRWAGRIIQPQNLPRTNLPAIDVARSLVKQEKEESLQFIYGSIPDTLSQLIRTALVPAKGKIFADADFSAIEARVLAWLAGEQWRLDVFRTHGKIYEASASQMFGVPIEKIVKGNPEYELRQRGKVAELALGYQGGVSALTTMDYAGALTEEEKPEIVKIWRSANPNIERFWYKVQSAAIETVRTCRAQSVDKLLFQMEGSADNNLWFLTILLPSGRKLFYAKPHLAPGIYGKDALRYYGVNQTSHQWCATDTYGGKLVENITQAIARDCLAEVVERLEHCGYPVVFHVHDEVVCEVAEPQAFDEIINIMRKPMPWAEDLLLNADGWVGEYFTKD